jgi:hypothetical protein
MVSLTLVKSSLVAVSTLYPQRKSLEEIEVAAQIWARVLPKDMTDRQFQAAMEVVVGKAKFFPTPGDVTEAWKVLVANEPQQVPAQALPFGDAAHREQCERNKQRAGAILARLRAKDGNVNTREM